MVSRNFKMVILSVAKGVEYVDQRGFPVPLVWNPRTIETPGGRTESRRKQCGEPRLVVLALLFAQDDEVKRNVHNRR